MTTDGARVSGGGRTQVRPAQAHPRAAGVRRPEPRFPEPSTSSAPEASAIRPHDVQPQAGRAGRAAAPPEPVGGRKARAVVLDDERRRRTGVRAHGRRAKPTPRRCGRTRCPATRPRASIRSCGSACTQAPGSIERRPRLAAGPRPARTRTPPARTRCRTGPPDRPAWLLAPPSGGRRLATLAYDGVDGALQPVQVLAQPGPLGRVSRRVDRQAQGRDRRAQPVRQVGGRLALGLQQLTDPAGQLVQRRTDLLDLGRPTRHAPGAAAARGEVVRDLGDRDERRGDPAGEGDRGCQRDDDQAKAQCHQQDSGPGDPLGQGVAGHADPDHARAGLRRDGQVDRGAVRRPRRGSW